MSSPLFVSFEGPEGAGKTTQVRLLAEALAVRGFQVVRVREPGGTALGERIRDVLLGTFGIAIDRHAEVLLFCAARAQLVSEIVRPALAEGQTVLADRFTDSTQAYQGIGRGLDSQRLRDVLSFAAGDLSPDLTILLDLPAEVGLARKRDEVAEWDRMERESGNYHERVRQAYLTLAAAEPGRWRVLDARRPAADLAHEIAVLVLSRLGQPS